MMWAWVTGMVGIVDGDGQRLVDMRSSGSAGPMKPGVWLLCNNTPLIQRGTRPRSTQCRVTNNPIIPEGVLSRRRVGGLIFVPLGLID